MLEALVAFDEVRRWSERQFDLDQAAARKPQRSRRGGAAASPEAGATSRPRRRAGLRLGRPLTDSNR